MYVDLGCTQGVNPVRSPKTDPVLLLLLDARTVCRGLLRGTLDPARGMELASELELCVWPSRECERYPDLLRTDAAATILACGPERKCEAFPVLGSSTLAPRAAGADK
ncbi:unnamed protein product [Ectocarpus sp. 13 AM-2016]